MSASIEDAFNLGWKLAAVVTGRARGELLETYALERKPAAHRIVKRGRRATRLTLLRRPFGVFAREHAASQLLERPSVRASVENALSQLDVSYRGHGAGSSTCATPSAGDRAPDAPVVLLGTEKTSTVFDVINGDEFSLFAVGGRRTC